MKINQYEIVLVNLDPTVGHEIKKTRPCVIISPDEMNTLLQTVIVAPITSRSGEYPTRVYFEEKEISGWIVLDQIRTIDRIRVVRQLGCLGDKDVFLVKAVIREMLVD